MLFVFIMDEVGHKNIPILTYVDVLSDYIFAAYYPHRCSAWFKRLKLRLCEVILLPKVSKGLKKSLTVNTLTLHLGIIVLIGEEHGHF